MENSPECDFTEDGDRRWVASKLKLKLSSKIIIFATFLKKLFGFGKYTCILLRAPSLTALIHTHKTEVANIYLRDLRKDATLAWSLRSFKLPVFIA